MSTAAVNIETALENQAPQIQMLPPPPETPNIAKQDTTPAPAPAPCRKIRNGKIARLPFLERDLVNRMLRDHIPYAKIVGALDEHGIYVTERNVSNWKTRGGYKAWAAEQDH